MANCSACNKKADNGLFSKKTLEIPTYGAWRDQRSFLGILEFKENYRILEFKEFYRILEFRNSKFQNSKNFGIPKSKG